MHLVSLDEPVPYAATDLAWFYLFDTTPLDLPDQDGGDQDDDDGLADAEEDPDGPTT